MTAADAMEEASKARVYTSNAGNAARQTIINNMSLSQYADQKASILMGATFLVFTVAVGQAGKGGGHVALPLLVLGGFALVAACFAISVVMPSIKPRQKLTGHENMMFFGAISQMDEDSYVERMLDHLADDEALMRMMMRDVWQNSQVLQHKKYRLLGYAYRCFLAGLLISAAVFAAQRLGVIA